MSAIKFIKANKVGKLIRPNGYIFPVGLSGLSNTVVDYLVIAGGGSGGSGWNHSGSGGGAGGYRTASGFTLSSATNSNFSVFYFVN